MWNSERMGWSLCHDLDRFSKRRGREIAVVMVAQTTLLEAVKITLQAIPNYQTKKLVVRDFVRKVAFPLIVDKLELSQSEMPGEAL
jgi:hypothetical protein